MTRITLATWENESALGRCVNTTRGLTRSSEITREGLAMKATRTCAVDDCDRPAHARGWCTRHYQVWKRNGDPTLVVAIRRPDECTVEGCARKVHGRGLCGAHWNRMHRHGDALGGGPDRAPAPDACIEGGCEARPHAHGRCNAHHKRHRLATDPAYRERKNAQWRLWALRNPEALAARARVWREANVERRAELLAAWKAANPWHASAYSFTKRRRRYGLDPTVAELVDPAVIYERDGGRCQLCGDPVDQALPFPDPLAATIDHVIPVIDPTSEHSYANTQLAHWDCNRRKNVTTEEHTA